jgi:hypothetical protein
MANSIGRMQGSAPEQLNAGTCANPRFSGNLGTGASSPKDDPLKNVAPGGAAGGPGGDGGGGGGGEAGGPAAGAAAGATATGGGETALGATGADAAVAASGRSGAALAVGGGSTNWRKASPVSYRRPGPGGLTIVPVLVLLPLVLGPPVVAAVRRRRVT